MFLDIRYLMERRECVMRTWKINIQPTKDAVLCDYFAENTTAAKCMYNVANFYIRNTMTGIRKSPEERTACETEVLHYIFTGIGVSNLVAVANNFGDTPFLIKGGALKSMNQKFNKQRAKLLSAVTKGSDSTHSKKETKQLQALSRKRDAFLRDLFYKTAWYLVRYAKKHQVDVIVIGHNEDQKQNICIGKQNNQNFVSIPFCLFIKITEDVSSMPISMEQGWEVG